MRWDVEGTAEFNTWFRELTDSESHDVIRVVDMLEERGPYLEYPRSSAINSSRHSHMRELRIQHRGRPYRILYAFDPRRTAILLLGGDKSRDMRWYDRNIPIADDLYDLYLRELRDEGLI